MILTRRRLGRFKCLVFELPKGNRRFVFSNGAWFEVDRDFATQIQHSVAELPVSEIHFPAVQWQANGKLEPEPEYNRRVATLQGTTALLDGKTAKCRSATTGIEPCDLLTEHRDLIHVKHRKGGSSSLSHLFAQARIAAEALVGDEEFRRQVRSILKTIAASWEDRVPLARPAASSFHIVFAILGVNRSQPGEELPFFSQLNLVRTAESLTSRGFRVSVAGVKAEPKSQQAA